MSGLEYQTAGESHGPALVALVEGMPADVPVDSELINRELTRRQGGYGRSGRQKIERDCVQILSGVRAGRTMGGPIAMLIANRDSRLEEAPPVHSPRPGHADLAGSLKWLSTDCRNTLERASARETAARTAAGALARSLLAPFGIELVGFVVRIGPTAAEVAVDLSCDQIVELRDASDVYCPDASAGEAMKRAIDEARREGDTLGGVVEVRVCGVCPGLGSCGRSQDKLDGRLMGAVGSIQAIKGVEIGLGFAAASRPGSDVHDAIGFDEQSVESPTLGFTRESNNAGGIEGGMTNGQPVVLRAAMKPISTLRKGLPSVDLRTKESHRSDYERSDVCAVPALSVIVENVVAFELARALLEKFGGDTLAEVQAAYDHYLKTARRLSS